MGNLRRYHTFVPNQDRGKTYLGKRLGDLITVQSIYPFTYEEIVRKASSVDVAWFNERRLPTEFIEVENTTDINGAFLKFTNFDGFSSTLRIVAPAARQAEFRSKLQQQVFATIAGRTKFTSYEVVSDLHSKASEIAALESQWAGAK